jgi:hypothetical protein
MTDDPPEPAGADAVECPSCSARVPPGAFCAQCGARLAAPPGPAFTDPGAWRNPPPPAAPGGFGPPPGAPASPAIPPPPPAYGYAAPYPAAPTGGTNGFAIAALVLALVWVCGLGSALAVIFGAVALSQIKQRQQQGRGLAIAGIVIGAIGVVLTLVLVIAAAVSDDDGNVTFNFGELAPQSYGDDARLDALWDDCEAADMGACDRLYEESPLGSRYEEFGATCGNRAAAEPGTCEVRFGG